MMPGLHEAARVACAEVGIVWRDVPADGQFYSTDVDGDKRGKGDGRIKLFADGQGGVVCNWKGEQKSFFVDAGRRPTEADRQARARQRETAEAESLQRREQARQQAREIWQRCQPLEGHAYLELKGIKAHGLRLYSGPLAINGMRADGALVIPIRDTAGELQTLEFIGPDGIKRFLPNGAKAGHYFAIGRPVKRILIAEGYATGASIHEATGEAVAVAFDAGNLGPVAKALREKYPEAQIIIAADNDQWTEGNPGVSKAREAVEAVGGFLCVPAFKDASSKPTDFNDLHKLEGLAAVSEAFKSPEPASVVDTWQVPEPLPELPAVEPLNMHALPAVLRAYVEDICERMQCPPDFPAAATLAMVGAAIGRKVGIRPKRQDNWTVVCNLWAIIVGRSGIMKSPALSAALAPLRQMQSEAFQTYEENLKQHEVAAKIAAMQADDAKSKAAKYVKEGNTIAAQTVLAQAQSDVDAPTAKRYIVNDSTVEALAETLEENANGVLVDRDELAGWLKSLDKDGQQEARAFYLTAANGDEGFTTDRITRGRGRHIPAVCVSIVGGIQPGVLSHYVRDTQRQGSGDDGLLQRFGIMVYPDVSREWRNVDRKADLNARKSVDELIAKLTNMAPASVGAQMDAYKPLPYLHFSEAAQVLFDEWREELETRLRSDDDHPAIISHLSKYRKLVPSLALINHLCDVGAGPVSESALAQALDMAVYLESHARRVYSYASRPDVDGAKNILAKIRGGKLPRIFTLRDVYRAGWSGLATAEEARPAIKLLSEFGYLRELDQDDRSGRPTEQYEAHSSIGGAS